MSNDSAVQAAMTPDEWRAWQREGIVIRNGLVILHGKGVGFAGVPRVSAYMQPMDTETHACAAACLYGHPFGFTREDVDALRACTDPVLNSEDAGWHTVEHRERLTSLMERIAALLPPE